MRDAERDAGDAHPESRDRVVNGDVTIRSEREARDVVAIRGDVRLEPGAIARTSWRCSGASRSRVVPARAR